MSPKTNYPQNNIRNNIDLIAVLLVSFGLLVASAITNTFIAYPLLIALGLFTTVLTRRDFALGALFEMGLTGTRHYENLSYSRGGSLTVTITMVKSFNAHGVLPRMADTQDQLSASFARAFSTAEQLGGLVSAVGTQIFNKVSTAAVDTSARVSEAATESAHSAIEQTTENVGKTIQPIAENPAVDYIAKVPGMSWLTSALGRVDKEKAEAEVTKLRAKYPHESAEDIAHRMIVDTTIKAGGVGFATNIIPPVALGLFAIDLAAVAALQSEMLYRIAAAYDFDVADPARKGEALAIFGLSLGTSTALKSGLSVVELIPIVGAAVGASSNAGILYSFGIGASQFYKRKREKLGR